MIERDPSLEPAALRLKMKARIAACLDQQLHDDLHYIIYRAKWESMKPKDHKAVNKAIKKIITPEMMRQAEKALHNPSDKDFAHRLRDAGEGLENLLQRMSNGRKRKD